MTSLMPPSNLLPRSSASHRRNCLPDRSTSRIAPCSAVHASRRFLFLVRAKPLWLQPGSELSTVTVLPSHFESVFDTQPTKYRLPSTYNGPSGPRTLLTMVVSAAHAAATANWEQTARQISLIVCISNPYSVLPGLAGRLLSAGGAGSLHLRAGCR